MIERRTRENDQGTSKHVDHAAHEEEDTRSGLNWSSAKVDLQTVFMEIVGLEKLSRNQRVGTHVDTRSSNRIDMTFFKAVPKAGVKCNLS